MIQVAANTLFAAVVYAVCGLSFSLCHRSTHVFHVAHAAAFVLPALITSMLVRILGWPMLLAACVGLATGAALMVGVLRLAYVRLIRLGSPPAFLFLLSLGVLMVLQNAIGITTGDATIPLRTPLGEEILEGSGVRVTALRLLMIAIMGIAAAATVIVVSRLSRALPFRAVAEDGRLAEAYGVNVLSVQMACFAAGSTLAGTVGLLNALESGIGPASGFRWLLAGVVISALARGIASADHFGWAMALAAAQAAIGGTVGWRVSETLALLVLVAWLAVRRWKAVA